MKLQNKRGFTLIELLVVITIIGILATGGATVYTSQMASARDSTRVKNTQVVNSAVEGSFADVGSYPTTANVSTEVVKYIAGGTTGSLRDPLNGTAKCGNDAATPTYSSSCDLRYNTSTDGYKVMYFVEKASTGDNTKKDYGSLTGAYEVFGGSGSQSLGTGSSIKLN